MRPKTTEKQPRRDCPPDLSQKLSPHFILREFVVSQTAARGGILAMLHPGEFVLRKEAVQAMGESLLSGFNRSPRQAAGGGLTVVVNNSLTVYAVDGASMKRWWRRNEGNVIRIVQKAAGDRAL